MTDAPLVLIRTDADASIGTGHLVRCLTLAAALQECGAQVVLAARALTDPLRARVAAAGVELLDLPATEQPRDRPLPTSTQEADADAVVAALEERRPDWVVVDSYALHAPWERRLRTVAARVAVVDDLADRAHDCDLLLDQNWFGPDTGERYDDLVPSGTTQLLGPRYALLQSAYRDARHEAPARDERPPRVVASFGGSDPTGELPKLLAGAGDLLVDHGYAVDVVIGAAAPDLAEVRSATARLAGVQLHSDLPSLAPLLAGATLGIGAGGATTWERICLDVPALVAVVADNQAESIATLDAADVVRSVGAGRESTAATYTTAVRTAIDGRVPDPPPLVDGWGAPRVALAMLGADPDAVRTRPATRGDRPLFLGPDHGPASYLAGPDVWGRMSRQFTALLADGTGVVGTSSGVPVAAVTATRTWTCPDLPAVRDLLAGGTDGHD